jgi:hypothetical protein
MPIGKSPFHTQLMYHNLDIADMQLHKPFKQTTTPTQHVPKHATTPILPPRLYSMVQSLSHHLDL